MKGVNYSGIQISERMPSCAVKLCRNCQFPQLTSAGRCGIMGASIAVLPLTGDRCTNWRDAMAEFIRRIWSEDEGQDIAEYAVMLAVILVLVVGTIRLIGSNANNVFSNTASSIQSVTPNSPAILFGRGAFLCLKFSVV